MHWYDVQATKLRPLPDGDVAGAIGMIRAAPLRDLANERFLVEEFLPQLGLNGEILEEFPEQLYPWCGHGIRSWQYPVQFARYLRFLAGQRIRSYVEIGCRFGGTFIIVVEYLRRFEDLSLAVAMDITPTDAMARYAASTDGVQYRVGDSADPLAVAYLGSRRWDLAFIDGDHSYAGCRSDFMAVKNHARLVGLHDIANAHCPGVVQNWQEISAILPRARLFEAVDQYADVRARTGKTFLGIGVAELG
jgi:hypothetical protein